MAEFALLTPLLIFFVFITITFAVIGQAELAVSQLASAGARYASVNPQLSSDQIESYIKSGALGSPTITANSGSLLTVSVEQAGGFGQPVTVTISYDLGSNILVSSMTSLFSSLGMPVTFPTTATATEIAMSE
jgi:Flp pilus assembly protein TadG